MTDDTTPPLEGRLRFDPRPEHVRDARDHVAELLSERGWSDASVDKARLVISELATNAVLHAQTPFELHCQIGGTARFEVRDWDPRSLPLVQDPEPTRAGGLGLRLIEAIATEWGVETHPEFKVVWCTLEPEAGSDDLDNPGDPTAR